MPGSNAPDIVPSRVILINEVSIATGIPVRKINRLIDDAVLPRLVCVRVGNRRALRAFAVPMVSFGVSDGTKLSKGTRLKVMRLIGRFVRENWARLRDEPELAKPLRFQSGCVAVSLGKSVSEAMAGLNKWIDARTRVVEDPAVRGGIPVMLGTRISVCEVADALAADGMDMALEDFPALSREDVEAAVLYAKALPRTGRSRASASPRRSVSEEAVDLVVVS